MTLRTNNSSLRWLAVVVIVSVLCWGVSMVGAAFTNLDLSTSSKSPSSSASSLTIATSSWMIPRSSTSLSLISSSQVAVLDGAEWSCLLECCGGKAIGKNAKHGYLSVVVGKVDGQQQHRVIGIQADVNNNESHDDNNYVPLSDQVKIYRDSMALIPSKVKDEDAISTLTSTLSVHCCLPQFGTAAKSKVVVLGGSDFACFAAEALATLGASVSLVSTRSFRARHPNVQVLTPAVGEFELGFCSVIGSFDALLDTLHDERKKPLLQRLADNDDREEDDEDDEYYASISASVVALLARQHSCTRYFSTLTQSQQIVRDAGILFGPRQANDHVKLIAQQLGRSFSSTEMKAGATPALSQFQYFGQPPVGFGAALQALFDRGVVLANPRKSAKTAAAAPYVRGWSLNDFWEYITWPRDTSAGDVRYGLPVATELDLTTTVRTNSKKKYQTPQQPELLKSSQDGDEDAYSSSSTLATGQNPFVLDVTSVAELQRDIINNKRDCVMFLSATYCRSCRYLQPVFTRLARTSVEDDVAAGTTANLLFAKAETSGRLGKELGRTLSVAAVPAFLLFRKGKRYGSPLFISKLPSKKLNWAISLLLNGLDWDQRALAMLEEDEEKSKK